MNGLNSANKVYYSFQDFAADFGRKKSPKVTKNENTLKEQQEKFLGKCKVCNHGLVYHIGTNIITCNNPDCKGIQRSRKADDGTDIVWSIPVVRYLDAKGVEIATNLFS